MENSDKIYFNTIIYTINIIRLLIVTKYDFFKKRILLIAICLWDKNKFNLFLT